MTDSARELRIKIAREVGFKPASMLKKDHLNSICAYLNGEWIIDHDKLFSHNEPNLQQLRTIIAAECDFYYDETKYDQPMGPVFNKDQLDAILRTLKENDDQRPFSKHKP